MYAASDDNSEFQRLTNWTHGGNHAFKRSCVRSASDSGRLRVAHGGHYVFYDHLAVCRCAVVFRQRVMRQTGVADAQVLLEDSLSSSGSPRPGEGHSGEPCAGEPAFSSHLFTLVWLEANDSVWIDAKPASAVYRANDASFFGLYRLSVV